MLSLTRFKGETIIIGDDIRVTILGSNNGQVKVGIDAPKNVSVHREEIYEKIKKEEQEATLAGSGARVTGSVFNLQASKGYGFVYSPGYEDGIFFHASEVIGGRFSDIADGVDVTLTVTQGEKSLVGKNVAIAERL